jgi:hypothetical protein
MAPEPPPRNGSHEHPPVAARFLLLTCVFVLLVTGFAKLATVFGHWLVLQDSNPVLPFLTNRNVIATASVTEIVVALYLLGSRNLLVASSVLFSLACAFLLYRIALIKAGNAYPCFCLGFSSNLLPMAAEQQDLALKALLAYIICVGSGLMCYAFFASRH